MGEIGYLIVAVIIIVASVLGKIQEQKRSQDRKKSRKPVRPEDLPEATRRLLYGTPDQPASESRTQPPQVRTAQPRTAEPRTAPPVQRQQPREVRRAVPIEPQTQRAGQQTAPPPPPVRKRAAARREMKPETSSLQARHDRVMAQRRKQLQEAKAQHAASLKKTQQMQQRMTRSGPRGGRHEAPMARPIEELFVNLDDVRRGIVMLEVLGRPKAFE